MNIFDEKIKKSVKESLGKKSLDESYVAQVKQFNINTDFLSPGNLNNHKELYYGYVEKFNEISVLLDSADRAADSNHSAYRALKNDETYNLNGAYLHELFFSNIGDPNSTIKMDSLSYMRLARDFGSFDDWQRDFIACGQSSRCGWVMTYLNMYTQSYMNCVIDLHSQNVPVGMYPIVVVDMWQHSYYKDYLKDSKTYMSAMMKQLRWSVIEKRIKKADKVLEIIRS